MKKIVIIGDVFIINIIYFLLNYITNKYFIHNLYIQNHIVISITYICCAMDSVVVLHYRKVKKYQIILKILRSILLFSLIATILLIWGDFFIPYKGTYILFLLLSFIFIIAWRFSLYKYIKYNRQKKENIRKVVFVGSSQNNVELYNELTDNLEYGYEVCGYFDDGEENAFPQNVSRLGKVSDVINWISHNKGINELYCCLPSVRKKEILPIINYCENNIIHFYSVPNVRNYVQHRMNFHMIGTIPYMSIHKEPLEETNNRLVKRFFDVIFSALFLCTLFPIIFLIVFCISKTTMKGKIFFKQKRNGLNGREFICYKFRTMRKNKEADTLQATKNDSRVTKWGKIMRKFNIDELPQFWNVLKGDMSVVGPRPHMVKHTEQYSHLIDKYMIRHWVKPGITGWSQVTGYRGETRELSQMEGRIRGDIWYIEHWSLGLDIYIIYKTIETIFKGDKKAY